MKFLKWEVERKEVLGRGSSMSNGKKMGHRTMFKEKQVGPVWCHLYINGRSRRQSKKISEGLLRGHYK